MLYGSDIGSPIQDIPSWEECGDLCSNNADCDSFTWLSSQSQCFLMTGEPNQLLPNPGAFSGMSTCLASLGLIMI